MRKQTPYLFVYGSLRKAANHRMHQLLASDARFLAMGSFQGKLYDLGRYPAAIASTCTSERVRGEIYRIYDADTVFRILDEYEGKLFKRRRGSVVTDEGKRITAWIYLYTGLIGSRRPIPSGDYATLFAKRSTS